MKAKLFCYASQTPTYLNTNFKRDYILNPEQKSGRREFGE